MGLNDVYELLNFYINKAQGGWYSPEEAMLMLDRAQMTLFNSYYTKYSTSQRLDDALTPFKFQTQFTNSDTFNGVLSVASNYCDLLFLYTLVTGSDSVTRMRPVEIVSEDELVIRLNSQVVPVTVNDPVGIIKEHYQIQLYPAQPAAGVIGYLRRPVVPQYRYSVVSGRVIVYDPINSIQLEWSDKDIQMIVMLALNGIGINLSEADIIQWSEQKVQQNFTTNIKQ